MRRRWSPNRNTLTGRRKIGRSNAYRNVFPTLESFFLAMASLVAFMATPSPAPTIMKVPVCTETE